MKRVIPGDKKARNILKKIDPLIIFAGMRKKKLYIETSVWNQLVHTDRPEWREEALRFLKTCELGLYELYISTILLDEINLAQTAIKNKLLKYLNKLSPEVLEYDREAGDLTALYIEAEIIKSRKSNVIADLSQVAIATVNEIRHIVSFNCKHLLKDRNIDGFNSVNIGNGYDTLIEITTPERFIDLPEEE